MSRVSIGELVASGVLQIGDGYRTKRSEHAQHGYRIIRVADVMEGAVSFTGPDFVSEKYAKAIGTKAGKPGDILLTTKGTVGRVAVLPDMDEQVVYSPQLCFFRVLDADIVDPRFFRYWFSSAEFWHQAADRMNNTDMAAYINLADIRSLKLTVPDVSEQRFIAEVLGALDDKIAANTKLAAISDELIAIHFRKAVESEGTEPMPLFKVINIDFGEPFTGANFSEPGTGRPLIRIRDLKTFSSQVWTTEIRPREVVVLPGDVVIGMDAEFRPTAWLGEPGLLNQRVCRARGRATGPAFVRETLKEPLSRIEGYKTATTVIHLNKKDLEETVVLLPSVANLQAFEDSVEGLYSHRVAIAIENRTLATLRDALLPQLMSGKLRVKDAEKVLENAGV